MDTAETGRAGEEAAREFLRKAGYGICAMNWRSGPYEIDIIARKGDVLHIVEVKTRREASLTPPWRPAANSMHCGMQPHTIWP